MKKIMFNDRYGLTKAVLEGRKTMTRRLAKKVLVEDENMEYRWNGEFVAPRYKVGEVVAVAQAYKDTWGDPDFILGDFLYGDRPGWSNKMFVSADLMPHQIRITNIRVERLQDISDEDCYKEGITVGDIDLYGFRNSKHWDTFRTPRKAFAALIDKVSGKGTWASNPWVFVYEFELVK